MKVSVDIGLGRLRELSLKLVDGLPESAESGGATPQVRDGDRDRDHATIRIEVLRDADEPNAASPIRADPDQWRDLKVDEGGLGSLSNRFRAFDHGTEPGPTGNTLGSALAGLGYNRLVVCHGNTLQELVGNVASSAQPDETRESAPDTQQDGRAVA